MTSLLNIIIYALLPFAAIIIGGCVGLIKKPSGAFTSSVLHLIGMVA